MSTILTSDVKRLLLPAIEKCFDGLSLLALTVKLEYADSAEPLLPYQVGLFEQLEMFVGGSVVQVGFPDYARDVQLTYLAQYLQDFHASF
jgi:hypothetical protein